MCQKFKYLMMSAFLRHTSVWWGCSTYWGFSAYQSNSSLMLTQFGSNKLCWNLNFVRMSAFPWHTSVIGDVDFVDVDTCLGVDLNFHYHHHRHLCCVKKYLTKRYTNNIIYKIYVRNIQGVFSNWPPPPLKVPSTKK